MIMIPLFYQKQLKSQLSSAEYLFIQILVVNILQSIKNVNLERLANGIPLPIKFESRGKRIQRFLSLPNLTIEKIWFPIIKEWLSIYFTNGEIMELSSCIGDLLIN
jgi:hypothetical protein